MRFSITCLHVYRPIFLVLAMLALGQGAIAQETTSSRDLVGQDPHGWILTLTSVSVVFFALVSLVIVFSLIGKLLGRSQAQASSALLTTQGKRYQASQQANEAEVAVAMALSQWQAEREAEVAAVIALALETELNTQHDAESFVLTIKPRVTQWNARSLGLRKGIESGWL